MGSISPGSCYRGLWLEAGGAFALFVESRVALCLHQRARESRLLFGLGVQAEVRINASQLIVGRHKLRIQLKDVFKCLARLLPLLLLSVKFAQFKKRIDGLRL